MRVDRYEAHSRVFGLRVCGGRRPRPHPSPWPRAAQLCFAPWRSLRHGQGLVTRYRSATVAGFNGVPRPLHAYVPARAGTNFQTTRLGRSRLRAAMSTSMTPHDAILRSTGSLEPIAYYGPGRSGGSVFASGATCLRVGVRSAVLRPPAHSMAPIIISWNFGLSQMSSRWPIALQYTRPLP